MPPFLSVVVVTRLEWERLREALSDLMPAMRALGDDLEVIAVCAGGARLRPADTDRHPGVRYLHVETPDVFAARALGASAATGRIVALAEDHAGCPPDWAPALVDAWRDRTDVDMLVTPVVPHKGAGWWETAVFTITFGPFMGIESVPTDRLPVPGNVSFRRALLPDHVPASGWIEYELFARVLASGRAALARVPPPVHVQPVTAGAVSLLFHSARMYVGTRLLDKTISRHAEIGRAWREVPLILHQSVGGRRRTNGGRLGARYTACLLCLVAAHAMGRLAGIVTRSPGLSARALE